MAFGLMDMPSGLTPRESDVLALIAEGLSNKDIGIRLNVTDTTVRSHTTNLYSKLGVSNRTEAALLAIRQELKEARAETAALRQQIADMQPEFKALTFYLHRAAEIMVELGRL